MSLCTVLFFKSAENVEVGDIKLFFSFLNEQNFEIQVFQFPSTSGRPNI